MRNSAPDADRVVRPLGRLWGPACRRVVTASRNLLPSDSRPFLPKIPRRSSLNRASTYRGRWRRSHRGRLTSRGLRRLSWRGALFVKGQLGIRQLKNQPLGWTSLPSSPPAYREAACLACRIPPWLRRSAQRRPELRGSCGHRCRAEKPVSTASCPSHRDRV